MAWHEILAWVIMISAAVIALAWCIKLIICPASRCEGCDKKCVLREKQLKK